MSLSRTFALALVVVAACTSSSSPPAQQPAAAPRVQQPVAAPNTHWTVFRTKSGSCMAQEARPCDQLLPCTPALPFAYPCPTTVDVRDSITVATYDGTSCVVEVDGRAGASIRCPQLERPEPKVDAPDHGPSIAQ